MEPRGAGNARVALRRALRLSSSLRATAMTAEIWGCMRLSFGELATCIAH